MSSSIQLPEDWRHPGKDEADKLFAELQRELPPGHLLYRVPVETFAWTGRGSDDILFRWLDVPDRFTVIHLSWLGRTEINAQHPTMEFDGSFAELLDYWRDIVEFLKKTADKRNKEDV